MKGKGLKKKEKRKKKYCLAAP